MEDKILQLFRTRKDFISGEELSKHLGISRAAIWKHIEKLREEGYEILATPHLGYKLAAVPDKLLPSEIGWDLHTKFMGKKIHSYERTDSTMDIAYSLAQAGEPEGSVVFAEEQLKGRGRLGRSWISPKGSGIYLSLVLRPDILPQEAPKITLLAALAVAKTIRRFIDLPALIKWPNDILIDGRKVCGILTEMNAEADTVKFLILGVGINVNVGKSRLPKGASSLSEEAGHDLSRIELARRLLEEVEEIYTGFKKKGFEPIIKQWRDLSATLGSRVRVVTHGRKFEGQAVDLDPSGALVVRLDNGFLEKVLAGDVIIVR